MNNSKIWLVVSPSVGVPVFLGAVAVGSFAVHVAVVTNTTWVSDFLSGTEMGTETAAMLPLDGTEPAATAHTASVDGFSAGQEILVTLPDGTTATAILQPPTVTAMVPQ